MRDAQKVMNPRYTVGINASVEVTGWDAYEAFGGRDDRITDTEGSVDLELERWGRALE